MDIKNLVTELESKEEYKRWRKAHPDSYLAHILMLIDKNGDSYQVGFYNKNNTMACFDMKDDRLEVQEEAEIFKKPDDIINEINLSEVKIKLNDALDKIHGIQHEKYPNALPIKKLVVLQNLKRFGLLFNVTYISTTMEVLNIKINAKTGEVIEEGMHKLFEFEKKTKK